MKKCQNSIPMKYQTVLSTVSVITTILREDLHSEASFFLVPMLRLFSCISINNIKSFPALILKVLM